jgi:hypothetical protein
MSKVKLRRSGLLRQWVSEISDYTSDEKVIFYKMCGKPISCEKKI